MRVYLRERTDVRVDLEDADAERVYLEGDEVRDGLGDAESEPPSTK